MNASSAANEVFLSTKELASRWGIFPQQLYKLRRSGRIPSVKLGHRTVRYRLSDVIAIEEKNLSGISEGDK